MATESKAVMAEVNAEEAHLIRQLATVAETREIEAELRSSDVGVVAELAQRARILELPTKPDANAECDHEVGLVHVLCRYQRVESLRMLLEAAPALARQCTKAGVFPIHVACRWGYVDVLEILKCYAEDPNEDYVDLPTQDNEGRPPATEAAKYGHLELLKRLKDMDADMSRCFTEQPGWNALAAATKYRQIEVVKWLVVDCHQKIVKTEEWGPWIEACRRGFTELVEFFVVVAGVNPDCTLPVRASIAHRMTLIAVRQGGWTGLMSACKFGRLDVIKLLLKHKAGVNREDNCKRTALSVAAQAGDRDVVKVLLDNKAVRHRSSTDGITPFLAACNARHYDLLPLLRCPPSPDVPCKLCETEFANALFEACVHDDWRCIEVLNRLGDIFMPMKAEKFRAQTIVHVAAQLGRVEILFNLLSMTPAACLKQDSFGWLPLMFAVSHKQIAATVLLLLFTPLHNLQHQTTQERQLSLPHAQILSGAAGEPASAGTIVLIPRKATAQAMAVQTGEQLLTDVFELMEREGGRGTPVLELLCWSCMHKVPAKLRWFREADREGTQLSFESIFHLAVHVLTEKCDTALVVELLELFASPGNGSSHLWLPCLRTAMRVHNHAMVAVIFGLSQCNETLLESLSSTERCAIVELQTLRLTQWSVVRVPFLAMFERLTELTMHKVDLPAATPWQHLSSVQVLRIVGCRSKWSEQRALGGLQVTELGLIDCDLRDAPEWIGRLSRLQQLDLSFNPLGEFKCRNVGSRIAGLKLNSCAAVGQRGLRFPALKSLEVQQVRLMPESFKSLSGCTALTHLSLAGSMFNRSAEALMACTALQSLDLSCTALRTLPKDVALCLTGLTSLAVNYCDLKELPDMPSSLVRLESDSGLGSSCIATVPTTVPVGHVLQRQRSLRSRDALPCNVIPVVLLGGAFEGKSTLLKAIQLRDAFPERGLDGTNAAARTHAVSLSHVVIQPRSESQEPYNLMVHDLAGQPEYQAVHNSMLLSASFRPVFVVVYDLSCWSSDANNRHNFRSRLGPWVQILRRLAYEPTMLLVGTHADQLTDEKIVERMHQLQHHLRRAVRCEIAAATAVSSIAGTCAVMRLEHPKIDQRGDMRTVVDQLLHVATQCIDKRLYHASVTPLEHDLLQLCMSGKLSKTFPGLSDFAFRASDLCNHHGIGKFFRTGDCAKSVLKVLRLADRLGCLRRCVLSRKQRVFVQPEALLRVVCSLVCAPRYQMRRVSLTTALHPDSVHVESVHVVNTLTADLQTIPVRKLVRKRDFQTLQERFMADWPSWFTRVVLDSEQSSSRQVADWIMNVLRVDACMSSAGASCLLLCGLSEQQVLDVMRAGLVSDNGGQMYALEDLIQRGVAEARQFVETGIMTPTFIEGFHLDRMALRTLHHLKVLVNIPRRCLQYDSCDCAESTSCETVDLVPAMLPVRDLEQDLVRGWWPNLGADQAVCVLRRSLTIESGIWVGTIFLKLVVEFVALAATLRPGWKLVPFRNALHVHSAQARCSCVIACRGVVEKETLDVVAWCADIAAASGVAAMVNGVVRLLHSSLAKLHPERWEPDRQRFVCTIPVVSAKTQQCVGFMPEALVEATGLANGLIGNDAAVLVQRDQLAVAQSAARQCLSTAKNHAHADMRSTTQLSELVDLSCAHVLKHPQGAQLVRFQALNWMDKFSPDLLTSEWRQYYHGCGDVASLCAIERFVLPGSTGGGSVPIAASSTVFADQALTWTSPSLAYASLYCKSLDVVLGDDHTVTHAFCILEVLVRPGRGRVQAETLGLTEEVDPKVPNAAIELGFQDPADVIVTGLLIAVGEDPAALLRPKVRSVAQSGVSTGRSM